MKKIDIEQGIFANRRTYLDNIVTLAEASKMLNVTDSYVRYLLKNGEFEDWEYRKSGRVTIFFKESIERRITKFNKNVD